MWGGSLEAEPRDPTGQGHPRVPQGRCIQPHCPQGGPGYTGANWELPSLRNLLICPLHLNTPIPARAALSYGTPQCRLGEPSGAQWTLKVGQESGDAARCHRMGPNGF